MREMADGVVTAERFDDWDLDTDQAAEYIGCSAGYLIKLRGSGDGPAFLRLFKRKGIKYSRRGMDLWKQQRCFGSTTEYPEAFR